MLINADQSQKVPGIWMINKLMQQNSTPLGKNTKLGRNMM